MKVMIVGAGIVGLTLARELLRRKVQVTIFEQGPIPNPIASSFDEHRITRHTYAELPGYGALMPWAFKAFEDLFKQTGRSHFVPTGVVYIGREGRETYSKMGPELDRMGLAHRPLGMDYLRKNLPQIRPDDVTGAYYAEGSGMLLADRILRDLAELVAAEGAEMHPFTQVEQIDTEKGIVYARGQAFGGDVVVSAAGAWVSELLPEYQTRLVSSRQMLLYLRAPSYFAPFWAQAPVIIDQHPTGGANILPPRAGTRLKIGDHQFTRAGSGSDSRSALEADLAPVLAAARRCLSDFEDYATVERKVCYYTVTGDARFVVEPAGSAAWMTSACSGHGFKLGPLTGRIAAMALMGEITPEQAKHLAAGRGDSSLLAR